jgi:hypothetical protein
LPAAADRGASGAHPLSGSRPSDHRYYWRRSAKEKAIKYSSKLKVMFIDAGARNAGIIQPPMLNRFFISGEYKLAFVQLVLLE